MHLNMGNMKVQLHVLASDHVRLTDENLHPDSHGSLHADADVIS